VVRLLVDRVDGQGRQEALHRLLKAAELPQRLAEEAVDIGVPGVEQQGLPVVGFGLLEPIHLLQGASQVEVGLGVAGQKRHGPLQGWQRHLSLSLQGDAQNQPGLAGQRDLPHQDPGLGLGFREPAAVEQGDQPVQPRVRSRGASQGEPPAPSARTWFGRRTRRPGRSPARPSGASFSCAPACPGAGP